MKAIVRHRYGSPDVLTLEEIPTPTPGDHDVLVKVQAVALNASDWEILRANPLYIRLVGFGFRQPKHTILGSDIAGRVEAVGRNVTEFQPGDEVFGDSFYCGLGGFAEYVSLPESAPLVRKPSSLTFEQAAAIPQSAVIALQALRDKSTVKAGQHVLIVGAGGGAGSFAVQIARSLGADVTAVDRTEKLEMMQSIGAHRVVDYTREDFTATGERYDLILDIVGRRSIFDIRRALRPTGTYLAVGGSTARIAQTVVVGRLLSMIGSQSLGMLAMQPNRADLLSITELCEAGDVRPVIDRDYPLAEAPDALRYLGAGHARGKVVLTL